MLVAGGSGYVGSELVPHLLLAGHRVRVLARDPGKLVGHSWLSQVEVARGDVLAPMTLSRALSGVEAAYYLVHSLAAGSGFHQRDVVAAENFGKAAKEAGVERLIYRGGLGDPSDRLSRHLRSRQQTGRVLRESGVPVTEFRAAIIVGAGSVSFQLIRHLTDRLPIMICPRWVYTRVQPIAIRDVISYLVEALTVPESAGKVVEIGGADVLTYRDMMLGYARAQHKFRLLIPVPFLTPRLSSHWVGLVTPIPADVAQPLILGLRNEVVVRDDLSLRLFPAIKPMGYTAALRIALGKADRARPGH
jgi:uncharacterized protein YbjT (DUF2867 family)